MLTKCKKEVYYDKEEYEEKNMYVAIYNNYLYCTHKE